MFTGIIKALGEVKQRESAQLIIAAAEIAKELSVGQSVAVNGVCLTAVRVELARGEFMVDLSPETLRRTNLGTLRPTDKVNLELPLRGGDRFDGHIVLGHVDTTGEILAIKPEADSHLFSLQVSREFDRLLAEKGCVAIDGISLTAFNIERGKFEVAIIPHTYQVTHLRYRRVGDRVNVEFDILGKYVEKLMRAAAYGGGHLIV